MATIYLIAPLPVLNCDVNDVYVGSTIQPLTKRLKGHRGHYNFWLKGRTTFCSSFQLFDKYGVENCAIIEIEQCPIEMRKEREAHWIGVYASLNKNKLTFERKEYMVEYNRTYKQKNQETHRQYSSEYYYKNRELILARKKAKRESAL